MPAPSFQAQSAIFALPTGARILPILLAHSPLDRAFYAFGQAQLEQVGPAAPLGFAHYRLIAEMGIAADQPRLLFGRQAIQILPQPGRGMLGGVLVAGRNLHRQHQPQIADHVTVITVRRSPGLVWIVAHHRTFLVPIERTNTPPWQPTCAGLSKTRGALLSTYRMLTAAPDRFFSCL